MKNTLILLLAPLVLTSCGGNAAGLAQAIAQNAHVGIKGDTWSAGYSAGVFGFTYDLTKRVKSGKEPVKASK